jgi:SAM-dependent methyltransferase
MVGRRAYNLMYRFGAPWETGRPRAELVDLVASGRLSPHQLAPGRAIDLGCGSGANSIFLVEHGFNVVGVDFSAVALGKAREAAKSRPGLPLRFVEADLTGDPADAIAGVDGPFDLLIDFSMLDDLPSAVRPVVAARISRWSRPGAVFVLWCFYDEVPWWRRRGARFPGLVPGAEQPLFGDAFTIERLPHPSQGSGFACFLMTRREVSAQGRG